MPELPEVQTIVGDLNKKIVGRKIVGVWFDSPKMISIILGAAKRGLIRGTTRNIEEFRRLFEKQIKCLKIEKVKRRGKNILIYLTKDCRLRTTAKNKRSVVHSPSAVNQLLLIHQKLTGHLLYGKWKVKKVSSSKFIVQSLIKGPLREKVNDYIHLIFYLDNGRQLVLSDLRKFAKVLFGSKEKIENSPDLAEIGPEPLDKSFKVEKFKSLITSQKRKIKQVLMDQKIIAGIGNIYSDEILWEAKIHPFRTADELKTYELGILYKAMRQILKKAVKLRGTSISDYRDTSGKAGAYAGVRRAYRREGEPCPRCRTPIRRIKIGGRSAHFCPKCQKL